VGWIAGLPQASRSTTRNKEVEMEFLAFASFAVLVVGWIVAPSHSMPAATTELDKAA